MASTPVAAQGGLGQVRRSCCFFHHDNRSSPRVCGSSSSVHSPSSHSCVQRVQPETHPCLLAGLDQSWGGPSGSGAPAQVLFPSLCGCQGCGRCPANNRSVSSQPVSGSSIFQDGDCLKDSPEHSGPSLGVQVGPEGRLFSRPCELAFPEVPGLCGRRADLCISVPSVRSVGRSLGLHKGDTAYKEPSSQVDVPGSLVFGRFSALGQDPRAAKQGLNLCPQPVQKSGLHHQRKEVFHHSFSGSGVLGGPLPVGLARADPSSGEGPQSGDTLRGNVSEFSRLKASTGGTLRASQLCSFSGSSGEATSSASLGVDELPHVSRFTGSSGSSGGLLCRGSQDMAGHLLPESKGSNGNPSSFPSAHDRCFTAGLGGSPPSSEGLRGVATRSSGAFNQLAGTTGNISFPRSFSLFPPREASPDYVRQYDSSGLHQESGYPEVGSSVRAFKEASGILPGVLHNSSSQASSGKPECFGRSGISPGSSFHRMVSRPTHLQGSLGQVWPFRMRFVRQQVQPTDERICLPLSGSSGSGVQCPVSSVGSVEVIFICFLQFPCFTKW